MLALYGNIVNIKLPCGVNDYSSFTSLFTVCMTTNFFQPPLHAALSGFALNNGVIELKFDDSNKLVGWAVGNSSDNPHSIQHSYLQYVCTM